MARPQGCPIILLPLICFFFGGGLQLWGADPPSQAFSVWTLVNDLDLKVVDPLGRYALYEGTPPGYRPLAIGILRLLCGPAPPVPLNLGLWLGQWQWEIVLDAHRAYFGNVPHGHPYPVRDTLNNHEKVRIPIVAPLDHQAWNTAVI